MFTLWHFNFLSLKNFKVKQIKKFWNWTILILFKTNNIKEFQSLSWTSL